MHTVDYLIIGIYLALIVFIGTYLQKKASKGIDSFFLGNRKLPWWALGASGMASNTDIGGTMIAVALVYALGTVGFFIEIRGGVVLVMAFFMIYMGKWTRRSQVMTAAEWMRFRFGTGKQGHVARILSAVANLIFSIAMISIFAIGAGKFAGEFLGIHWKIAALAMASLAMIYTVASGLYGVVWTDVFQGILIFVAIIYLVFVAFTTVNLPSEFTTSVPNTDGTFQSIRVSLEQWSAALPPARLDLPGIYSMYNLFAVALVFYFFKVTIEGGSGGSGYMVQRYLSARTDREAGLLSLFWTLLLMFKWPLVVSVAMLGIHFGIVNTVIPNPELVLPTVINHFIPVGIKGLLVAAFIAAAMSTFDSTVNAGAAFWVKDLFQGYINPEASERKLIIHSRVSSIVIVILGLLLSFTVSNINDIWGWVAMGISAGLLIPQLFRWYWWRFNGYGYAIGTGAGMLAAIISRIIGGNIPEYYSFIIASAFSLSGCIIGTYLTQKTDDDVLVNFYNQTRPFGFWKKVSRLLPDRTRAKINRENGRDMVSILLAIGWQLSLFLGGMMVIMKRWNNFFILLIVFCILSVILYFNWYRHLSDEVSLEEEGPSR
jgi:SSS family solute:Na+ symporter